MRKKAVITGGVTAAVLGGALVLGLNGGGTASAERTAAARPAAASPSVRSIGRAEAEQIALTAVPGGRVRSAERETEHGAPVWSVRVVKDGVTHDLHIDARTGKVLRDRTDRRTPTGRRHDDSRATEPRHAATAQRHDRGRETEARHGTDDATDDHGHGHAAEPGDDHGHHGAGTDDHGNDDGHRGHDG
ncbi:PepSY domain-containing protein [Actinoallomurus sp. CA-142502]|uniref:PepSY domain-containing protein n=1 Tax=Actinoallomurus sp. CA-142502 TaxID=3239885 RepID=UPI003D8A9882